MFSFSMSNRVRKDDESEEKERKRGGRNSLYALFIAL
jgi:hypothetical protein